MFEVVYLEIPVSGQSCNKSKGLLVNYNKHVQTCQLTTVNCSVWVFDGPIKRNSRKCSREEYTFRDKVCLMFVKYNLGIGTFQGSGIKDGSETYSILTVCSLSLLSLSLTRSYIAFIQNPSPWGALFIHCLFSFDWRKQNIHYNNIYVLSPYLNENVVIQCLISKIFT